MTEYREIPGFPGYRIGTDASVWSAWSTRGVIGNTWKPRKVQIRRGYCEIVLARDGAPFHCFVHALLLVTFTGPRPEGMEALHGNDIGTDNRLDNLRWGTRTENSTDRRRNGRIPDQ